MHLPEKLSFYYLSYFRMPLKFTASKFLISLCSRPERFTIRSRTLPGISWREDPFFPLDTDSETGSGVSLGFGGSRPLIKPIFTGTDGAAGSGAFEPGRVLIAVSIFQLLKPSHNECRDDFDQYAAQPVKPKYVARAFLITRTMVTFKQLPDLWLRRRRMGIW
jgi:hypothetical protein